MHINKNKNALHINIPEHIKIFSDQINIWNVKNNRDI